MRPLTEFVEEASRSELRLRVNTGRVLYRSRAAGDALFQVPVLALCVLVMLRRRGRPIPVADCSVLTAAVLGHRFLQFRPMASLEWSVAHRRRCADALVFLEASGLVRIALEAPRSAMCSEQGREFINTMLRASTQPGLLTREIDRSFRLVEKHGFRLL